MSQAQQQQQRYRVIERLASGGMAEVFVAESAGLEGFKKRVAIKRVLPHLSQKKRFIAMFLDEARLSAHLSHSNCVQVFDIGIGDNAYFIVMEFVDGADLKAIIEYVRQQKKPFPLEAAVLIAIRICEGLSYAHELTSTDGKPLSIVHRDMSPPNVLITKHGEVKIVDFGLAKASSQLEKSEAGIIKGKFGYLSPEAALGEEVDHRTDIFAVGIILWEILAGQRLFLGETDFQTVKQVQQAKAQPLSEIRSDVPKELDVILARALARDPDQRYQAALDLGRDLTKLLYARGVAVGAYDIAEIVRGAMQMRRKKKSADTGSLLDKLIEEALFEFTSLQDGGGSSGDSLANEPIKVTGFDDMAAWAKELDVKRVSKPKPAEVEMRRTLTEASLEMGNLAALEDVDIGPASSSGARPAPISEPRRSEPGASGAALSRPSQPGVDMVPTRKKEGGGAGLFVGVFVAVVAAAVAAAYFTGNLPI